MQAQIPKTTCTVAVHGPQQYEYVTRHVCSTIPLESRRNKKKLIHNQIMSLKYIYEPWLLETWPLPAEINSFHGNQPR